MIVFVKGSGLPFFTSRFYGAYGEPVITLSPDDLCNDDSAFVSMLLRLKPGVSSCFLTFSIDSTLMLLCYLCSSGSGVTKPWGSFDLGVVA